MANLKQKRPQNVPGDFFVDSTCIDCDTCRWMAPKVFHRAQEQSAVYHQPESEEERQRALQALLSCPTASIGTVDKPKDIARVQQGFPLPIADNVYHCGYHSEASYGAASYFIQRPEGNILVDSPRFAPPLVKRIEQMGGIKWMYLTHRDDVADHRKYQAHFRCDRILHQDDISADTAEVEIQISGTETFELGTDLIIIPVPGHTKGHTVLLYQDKFLFSGDHLSWSKRFKQLIAFRNFCWYSWPELIQSMHKLTSYHFNWILPGHGQRYYADSETMQQQLVKCIRWMEQEL